MTDSYPAQRIFLQFGKLKIFINFHCDKRVDVQGSLHWLATLDVETLHVVATCHGHGNTVCSIRVRTGIRQVQQLLDYLMILFRINHGSSGAESTDVWRCRVCNRTDWCPHVMEGSHSIGDQ